MTTARQVALGALERIDDGAYANLVLPSLLARSGLDERDRHFATELVYGTTRARRACDWLVDRHARGDIEPRVRNVLRLGAYQLHWLQTAPHAAVGETVSLAPKRARGLVNAVLRAVAAERAVVWPDLATELSYPDWVVDLLRAEWGNDQATAALRAMNQAPAVTERDDGYVQDRASQWVAESVDAKGERVADLCAAPGGKATALAADASLVIAIDLSEARAGLVARNAARTGCANVATVVADGRRSPAPGGAFGRVLVDAPCTGLGVLHRRPDARWRVQPSDVDALAALQRELLTEAVRLVAPGGRLVYSVCTMTRAETVAVDDWLASEHPRLQPLGPLPPPWRDAGRGSQLLPQDATTDGMFVLRLRIPDADDGRR